MSLFITFEGGEGCGKSFQAKKLYDKLCRSNIPAILTYEPGGTPLGDEISRWLKWQESEITPLTELFLFNASRNQLVEEVIIPNLELGKVVICDRFADSTIVYQGYGRGLDIAMTRTVNSTATRGLTPNLTILLDLPSYEGFSRKKPDKYDRFEKEEASFHDKIRQGYLELAAEEPQRWFVIDASQDKARIADIIWQKVSRLLPRRT
ncbi:MAG TPA: dTMP kinase [Dehalococcoidia bacterium]|nr:dTMP kinase [Dehalococcoidia bacterium]